MEKILTLDEVVAEIEYLIREGTDMSDLAELLNKLKDDPSTEIVWNGTKFIEYQNELLPVVTRNGAFIGEAYTLEDACSVGFLNTDFTPSGALIVEIEEEWLEDESFPKNAAKAWMLVE